MSCPKCEPEARRQRWVWWGGVVLLLAAGAWLERSRGTRAGDVRAAPAAAATR